MDSSYTTLALGRTLKAYLWILEGEKGEKEVLTFLGLRGFWLRLERERRERKETPRENPREVG